MELLKFRVEALETKQFPQRHARVKRTSFHQTYLRQWTKLGKLGKFNRFRLLVYKITETVRAL